MGHGDIISAWVLAVHRLAYSQVAKEKVTYEPGTVEWVNESTRRIQEFQQKQQDDYLRKLEKEVRKGMNARKLRQVFEGRY